MNIVHGIISFGVLNFLHDFYYLSIRVLLYIVRGLEF